MSDQRITTTVTLAITASPGASGLDLFGAFVLELQKLATLGAEQLERGKELAKQGPTDPPEGD